MAFDPTTMATGPALARLGWVLLHFLWQGALLAALFWCANFILRHRSANARYLAGCATLLLMAAAPLVTCRVLHLTSDTPGTNLLLTSEQVDQFISMPFLTGAGMAVSVTAHTEQSATATLVFDWRGHLNKTLPWLAIGWIAGAAMMVSRQLGGWMWLTWAVRSATAPLHEPRLEALAARLVRRPVRFLESTIVHAPATLGVIRPIVLLPVCAMTGLTPRQLEAILAHELAHIRRWDYFVNMAQASIEAVLFFHPGVWWVSRRVRQERENCCDDIAAHVVGDRTFYATALEKLERLRPAPAPQLALGATGGDLLIRIGRLLGVRPYDLAHVGRGAGVFWAMTCGIVLLLAVELLAASGANRSASVAAAPSIASVVYEAMRLPRGQGAADPADSLAAIAAGIQSTADDEPSLRAFAENMTRGGDPDALAGAIFEHVRVDSPIAYQSSPDWRYGSFPQRHVLLERLLDRARDANRTADERRLFARAAVALAAQDAALFGTSTLKMILDAAPIVRAAGLTDDDLPAARAAIARHDAAGKAFAPLLLRAKLALAGASPSGSTRAAVAEIDQSLRAAAPLARHRADLQWHLANALWQYQSRAGQASSALIADVTTGLNAPHFDRWMAQSAMVPAPQDRAAAPMSHAELELARNVTRAIREKLSAPPATPPR